MTRASESRTYGQHPQRKDQQGEFEIPLNHEAKTIFVLTILLPIACYFLTRGCHYWHFRSQTNFQGGFFLLASLSDFINHFIRRPSVAAPDVVHLAVLVDQRRGEAVGNSAASGRPAH